MSAEDLSTLLQTFEGTRTLYIQWKSHREKLVDVLILITIEIQLEEHKERIGQIAYSSVGIISGGLMIAGIATAPFTFGVSLGLIIPGAVLGGVSGLTSILHSVINWKIVKQKSTKAEEMLEEDKVRTEELLIEIEKVGRLADKFCGSISSIAAKSLTCATTTLSIFNLIKHSVALDTLLKVPGNLKAVEQALSLGKTVQNMLPKAAVTEAAKGIFRISRTVTIPLSVAGIVIDILSIANNSRKIHKDILSDKAKLLSNEINKILDCVEKFDKVCTGLK